MNTIRRQSIVGTIIIYLGAVIGFVNTGILLPRLFQTEQVGLINILVAYAVVFAQFSSLGFNSATTRLFPYFRTKDASHHGFLSLGMSVNFIGFLLGSVVFLFLANHFVEQERSGSELISQYIYYVIPLMLAHLLFMFLDTYAKVLFKATTGLFLKEFVLRFLVLIDIVLYVTDVISFDYFILGYLISHLLIVLILLGYLCVKGWFKISIERDFITKKLGKELFFVSLFGILAGFMGVLTINVDRIMVERLVGLSATGIYATAFYFGSVVALPARSITKISSAFLAEAWKNNDKPTIKTIYEKSTITQFIVGGLVLTGLIVNLDNIIQIMGDAYMEGKLVIVFIGIAYLSDMLAGVSSNVLMTSSKYKVHTIILVVFLFLIIASNFVFIGLYGLVGAALASMLSKIINNVVRIIYIKKKFNLFPYNYRHILVLVIMLVIMGISYFFSPMENYIIDIMVRSSIVSAAYLISIYLLNLSPDINERIETYWGIILKKVRG